MDYIFVLYYFFSLGCIINTIFVTESLSSSFFLKYYLYVCVHLCLCLHMCVQVCVGSRGWCVVSLSHSPSEFLRQGLWLKLEFTDSARLAAQWAERVFPPLLSHCHFRHTLPYPAQCVLKTRLSQCFIGWAPPHSTYFCVYLDLLRTRNTGFLNVPSVSHRK